MLRRFMNWLLHQLQKVLGAISGRRSNSRPFTAEQNAADATASKESGLAPTDRSTSSQTDISFSIQSAAPLAQPSSVSQKDAAQRAIENADDADTHMRLNAASSSVPGSQLELSGLDAVPGDPPPSIESIADIQSANQLPSIHDLLPAVEQEIKANSVHFDEEEALVASDAAVSDRVPSELETALENNDLDEVAEPVQALLFSFDIIESASEEGKPVEEENSVEEENVAESVQFSSSSSESINEETLPETAIALEGTKENSSENPQESVANDSDSTAFDKASLPYPWSIATPRKTSISEDKPMLPLEDEKQTHLQTKEDSATNQEAVSSLSFNPASTQPLQETNYPTKNGVVKLLFTMKEGNFHGYIEPKDGTPDILFHQKYINRDIFDSLERGVEVVVSVEHKEGKAYATQVELA
ncbi:MAG: hypothetical protein DCF25_06470 [Leptolyngbya foveolarum]|uniref:CSD domain-containing protein n=1 Tax=Leptolyngbya foveolarum TaxID=47253 RepID=A0A2W4UJ69_9CYAN|nr:MAG: hypothetical protein DCF25_06470 [Leptolyngbya foveolarum]